MCPNAENTITVQAEGFAPASAKINKSQRGTSHLNVQLAIAGVQADVQGARMVQEPTVTGAQEPSL